MRFTSNKSNSIKTTNYEDAVAYKLNNELALYSAVCTSVFYNKFYESNEDFIIRLRKLIAACDSEFVSKLAIYAREKMYLRTIPLVLLVELAKIKKLNASTVFRVIQRADEIVELLGYYQLANGRTGRKKLNKLSKAIQHGIKQVFESGKFDEYQFAKYNRKADITLKDALFLTHPKPASKEQAVLFKKIVDNSLKTPYTWEVELSIKGNNKETWEELIQSRQVGYMALLRNLRNILSANVSLEHMAIVCDIIANKENVLNSKQLPFRFYSAYNQVKQVESFHTANVLSALETAVKYSVENIKGFDDNTKAVIACDVSGSMMTPISAKSKIEYYDIGVILAMLLKSKYDATITGMFGDSWKTVNFYKNEILSAVDEIRCREGEVGYSTNGYLVIQNLINKNIIADKVMIFTDCQMWDSNYRGFSLAKTWARYKEINPSSRLYLFDMAGYGNTPIDTNSNDVYFISGWSDKIFDILVALEEGSTIIEYIKSIE